MITLPPVKQVGGGSLNCGTLDGTVPPSAVGWPLGPGWLACLPPWALVYTPDCSHLPCPGLALARKGRKGGQVLGVHERHAGAVTV